MSVKICEVEKKSPAAKAGLKKGDVITMFQDGLLKVLNGLTSIEEVMRLIEVDDNDKISEYDHQKSDDQIEENIEETENKESVQTLKEDNVIHFETLDF